MKTKLYRVTYQDPETSTYVTVEKEFEDSPEFPAKMWAEDFGYTAAGKGKYRVEEVK